MAHYNRAQATEFAYLCAKGSRDEVLAYAEREARENTGPGWQEAFAKLAKWLRGESRPPWAIFAENGNTKLPFYAFSTLPLATCPGMGECAKYCYSLRAWRYPDALMRQAQNTMLLRFKPGAIVRPWHAIPSESTVRLYVDGDFDSLRTAGLWFGLCSDRPDLCVYGYSKSWEILLAADARGWIPANYTLNLSSGSKYGPGVLEQVKRMACVRGEFIAVKISGEGLPKGAARYERPEYHRRVREAAAAEHGRVFSCPGKCGECTGAGHACGAKRPDGSDVVPITIAIGVH